MTKSGKSESTETSDSDSSSESEAKEKINEKSKKLVSPFQFFSTSFPLCINFFFLFSLQPFSFFTEEKRKCIFFDKENEETKKAW